MGDILFLAHRIPFPPDRGDKIRSHNLLKSLARLAKVHVATFAENENDRAHETELKTVSASYLLVDRKKRLPVAGVEAIGRGKPVSLTAFDDSRIRRWVSDTIANEPIETIFVFSGQMGQYIPKDFPGRIVVDLCDVDSAKFEAYAAAGERPWLNRREGRTLSREEERLVELADVTLLISQQEVDLLRSRAKGCDTKNIAALGNGIDASFFDPAGVDLHEDLADAEGPHFVFTGQMDYQPNFQAALWVIREMMPLLRGQFPQCRFHVVGRNPVAELKAYHGENGVRVRGEVPDVRPFLAAADVVLAPLEIARGVQNKVLEAMAMARPVLLTREAATGIDGRAGLHYITADLDAETMVCAVGDLLANPEVAREMGAAARRFVVENKSWDAVLAPLPAIVGIDDGSRSAA